MKTIQITKKNGSGYTLESSGEAGIAALQKAFGKDKETAPEAKVDSLIKALAKKPNTADEQLVDSLYQNKEHLSAKHQLQVTDLKHARDDTVHRECHVLKGTIDCGVIKSQTSEGYKALIKEFGTSKDKQLTKKSFKALASVFAKHKDTQGLLTLRLAAQQALQENEISKINIV